MRSTVTKRIVLWFVKANLPRAMAFGDPSVTREWLWTLPSVYWRNIERICLPSSRENHRQPSMRKNLFLYHWRFETNFFFAVTVPHEIDRFIIIIRVLFHFFSLFFTPLNLLGCYHSSENSVGAFTQFVVSCKALGTDFVCEFTSALDDSSLLHHDNPLDVLDSTQSMSDYDHRSTCWGTIQRFL